MTNKDMQRWRVKGSKSKKS